MTTLRTIVGYRDAPAAIDWLGRAFGFGTTMVVPDEDGDIAHSELRLGDAGAAVIAASSSSRRA